MKSAGRHGETSVEGGGVEDCRLGKRCTFHVRCPGAQAVYLMGDFTAAGGRSTVVPLHRAPHDDAAWRVTLTLPAGSYRFRFFVDDGRRVVLFCTSDRLDAWEAVLAVHDQRPTTAFVAATPDSGDAVAVSGSADVGPGQSAAWVSIDPEPREIAQPMQESGPPDACRPHHFELPPFPNVSRVAPWRMSWQSRFN